MKIITKKNIKSLLIYTILLSLLVSFSFKTNASTNSKYLFINSIQIDNILKKAISIDENGNVLIADEEDYQIVYMPSFDHEFLIDIKSSPFEKHRKKAEDKLLKLLNISKSKACFLYVVETTTNRENLGFAYNNYPLSFCSTIAEVPTLNPTSPIHITPTSIPKPTKIITCENSTDVNRDGVINSIDYAKTIIQYGSKNKSYNENLPPYQKVQKPFKEDVNCDGIVDAVDLSKIIEDLGKMTRFNKPDIIM